MTHNIFFSQKNMCRLNPWKVLGFLLVLIFLSKYYLKEPFVYNYTVCLLKEINLMFLIF